MSARTPAARTRRTTARPATARRDRGTAKAKAQAKVKPKAKAGVKPRAAAAPAATVALGQPVSDFTLPATGGAAWRLADARGSKLVLYFYPRDNTPGCTLEGRDFAELAPRFAAAGTRIVGISRDSIGSHERFRDKMGFPFPLLSDADETVCRQFDVMRMKNLYGHVSEGVERSTFLLDAGGIVRRVWRKVQVKGHALEVLAAAQAL